MFIGSVEVSSNSIRRSCAIHPFRVGSCGPTSVWISAATLAIEPLEEIVVERTAPSVEVPS